MPKIWTIGHSTRDSDAFVAALHSHGVRALVDVRRFPGSRRHPQFNADALAHTLLAAGIAYLGFGEQLGGRRRPRPDSTNTVWRNAGFKGYADYMETPAFARALEHLLRLAHERPTAIMCAELLWFRCHRALIADALEAKGVEVIHIHGQESGVRHPYTSAARIVAGRLHYGTDAESERR